MILYTLAVLLLVGFTNGKEFLRSLMLLSVWIISDICILIRARLLAVTSCTEESFFAKLARKMLLFTWSDRALWNKWRVENS